MERLGGIPQNPAVMGGKPCIFMKRFAMRVAIAILLCLAIAVPALAAPAQFTGRVVAIADGNTIIVLTPDKRQVKIRLYGIDCPESGQAFGKRAKEATSEVVLGKKVTVQPIEQERDDWAVAIVLMSDGRSLNEHLIREGMAWVYSQYCKLEEICAPLRSLEQAAKMSKRGLWIDEAPIPPWEWRDGLQCF